MPETESARLRELESYQILDTPAEPQFDAVTRLAAAICGMPIARITMVDADRLWLKSCTGARPAGGEIPRAGSFCAEAIQGAALLQLLDADLDVRFRDYNPAAGADRPRFYAGVPLTSPGGFRVGTLCVIDTRPRQLTPHQREALHDLAMLVIALMEARKLRQSLNQAQRELALGVGAIDNMVDAQCWRHPCLERVLIPAGRFSGDVIALQAKPNGAICGMVADVTGHGLSSALYVIPTVQAFYKMCAKDLAPAALCVELNNKIRQLAGTGRFMAAVIFEIDARAQSVSVWNGGMPAALYLDPAGTMLRKWSSQRPALGVLSDDEVDASFDTYRWPVAGQFLAFSDGLVDAAMGSDPSASALRVAEILHGSKANERVRRLVEIVDSHRRRSAHRDDVAILALDCERLTQATLGA